MLQSINRPIHIFTSSLLVLCKLNFLVLIFCLYVEVAALSPHENIILGDVNINTDSQNCWTDNFNPVLSDFDFIQHVSMPTHIHGHILDVLYTSESLCSSVCHYVKDGISEHMAVFFTTSLARNSCRVKCSKVRKLGKINNCEFISDIANSELVQAPYTKQLVYYHSSIFIHLLEKHAPRHGRKTPQHVSKRFINSKILAAKRCKHKVEREWQRDNSAINCSRYIAAANHFNHLLECLKTKYYSMVRENEDNPMVLWISIKKVPHRSPKIVLPDHTTISSLTNTFCKYFEDKIAKLRSGLLSTDVDPPVPVPARISLFLSRPCQRMIFSNH